MAAPMPAGGRDFGERFAVVGGKPFDRVDDQGGERGLLFVGRRFQISERGFRLGAIPRIGGERRRKSHAAFFEFLVAPAKLVVMRREALVKGVAALGRQGAKIGQHHLRRHMRRTIEAEMRRPAHHSSGDKAAEEDVGGERYEKRVRSLLL